MAFSYQWSVGASHDGHAQGWAGPGDFHVGHLPFQNRQPSDSWNEKRIDETTNKQIDEANIP